MRNSFVLSGKESNNFSTCSVNATTSLGDLESSYDTVSFGCSCRCRMYKKAYATLYKTRYFLAVLLHDLSKFLED